MPKDVIFDLFHTLVGGADDERDRVVGEMATIVGVEPADLVRAYHETWRSRLTRWDVEQTVRILAVRLGGSPSDTEVATAAALRRALAARLLGAVAPTTIRALDALRDRGCRLALVSNATAETAEAWPACALAPRFETAVFSCVLGHAKPDREIYLAASDALGASPADCLYVGDGADGELVGAAALGMTAIRTIELHDSDPSWKGPTIASLASLVESPWLDEPGQNIGTITAL